MNSRTATTLDAAGIAARIPHQGAMCLLDALLDWSATHVLCSARSHADAANPLRTDAGLLAPVAIEYAAQAMALHASLRAPQAAQAKPGAPGAPPSAGFLASARDVRLHVARLDLAPGPLQVRAEQIAGDARQALYRFTLHDAAGRLLVDGRAAVVLDQALA